MLLPPRQAVPGQCLSAARCSSPPAGGQSTPTYTFWLPAAGQPMHWCAELQLGKVCLMTGSYAHCILSLTGDGNVRDKLQVLHRRNRTPLTAAATATATASHCRCNSNPDGPQNEFAGGTTAATA